MKITVTRDELLSIVTSQLGYKVTEIVITKSTLANEIASKLAKELGIPDHQPLNQSLCELKIPAIKSLRTHIPGMGLAEAKWAILDWTQWIEFVKSKGRIPKMTFNTGYDTPPTLS